MQKDKNLLKTKKVLNTEIQPKWGLSFCIYLVSGEARTLEPPSVAPLLYVCVVSFHRTRIE